MNKDEKLQITKDKLIESTFGLMEEMDDPMKVTSREIAQAAGVKAGMINYCFGSRENLIYQVFQRQYKDFIKDSDVKKITESELEPKEVLKQLHFIVANCLLQNPKFTKAITGFVLFKRDLSKESFSYPYVYKHYRGKKTEEECKLIAYELSTMMQLIIYRRDDLLNDFGIDLSDDVVLKHYIDMRVDLLLKD
ncbi:MAG: TetR/AcrR family transcriptional regulator [Lachnospiraceae bacterium]|nr:TetR/AcrR family transcriptional regulator [Lachnospiraceae bacterium]